MPITRKNQKFIDEYMKDLNATQAAIRAGYSVASARSIASELLTKPDVKAEVAKRMAESRMTSDEVVARLQAMAAGEVPTKTVETEGKELVTYDVLQALDKMGKIYALFVDKQIVENIGLEIIDDEESADQSPGATP